MHDMHTNSNDKIIILLGFPIGFRIQFPGCAQRGRVHVLQCYDQFTGETLVKRNEIQFPGTDIDCTSPPYKKNAISGGGY